MKGKARVLDTKPQGRRERTDFHSRFWSVFSAPSCIFLPLRSSPERPQMFQTPTPLAPVPVRDSALSHSKYAREQKCIKGLKHSIWNCKIWALGLFLSLTCDVPSVQTAGNSRAGKSKTKIALRITANRVTAEVYNHQLCKWGHQFISCSLQILLTSVLMGTCLMWSAGQSKHKAGKWLGSEGRGEHRNSIILEHLQSRRE